MSTTLNITIDKKTLSVGAPIPLRTNPQVYEPADSTALAALSPAEGDYAIQADDGSSWLYDGTQWVNTLARWVDAAVPFDTVKAGGVRPPSFEKVADDGAGSAGVYAYHFDATNEEEVFFSKQVPHDAAPQVDWRPHIHWMPKTNASGNVVWLLEYGFAAVGDALPTNTSIVRVTDAADGTALKHQVASFPHTDMSAYTGLSGMFVCRVSREAGNAADTYPDDAIGLEFDWHYLKLGAGSRQEYTR